MNRQLDIDSGGGNGVVPKKRNTKSYKTLWEEQLQTNNELMNKCLVWILISTGEFILIVSIIILRLW